MTDEFEIGDTVRVRFDGRVTDIHQKVRIGGRDTGDAEITTLVADCLDDFEDGENGFVEFEATVQDFDGGILPGSKKFLVFEMESERGVVKKTPMIDPNSHHFSVEKI